ncbi:MAG: NYN domain-containing protein [Ardenticatenaceae bacterium]|nr:NYN domain-containing protein [Anaerolineales bacterium]MCB8920594.1 NYN domain-containing protein [Ardenticatenaceae bacterium]MCB8990218.1 NYN domain-containing protein [Ardenticatenaceae bacterium]MCB9002990.1 NYN domain-containing protein [Ardenticatenaceae bacterium]
MVGTQENQVAVFIDYQNLRNADWPRIMAEAEKLGRIVIKRAYADWTRHRSDHHALLSLGVDVEQVSSKRGKNAADIRIAIDAMDVLLDKRTSISHVFLISGDGDFTDLVNRLKFYGKVVIGLGTKEATADYLREACDEYIYYEDLAAQKSHPKSSRHNKPEIAKLDLNASRILLQQVLANHPNEWVSAGKAKREMRHLNKGFDENALGYNGFLSFVRDMSSTAEIRYADGGHAEVRLLRATGKLTLEAAQRLVRQAIMMIGDEWVLSARLKPQIRQLRSDFDENALGFSGFNAFLEAQTSVVVTRRSEDSNLEVRLLTEGEMPAAPPVVVAEAADEETSLTLLEQYVHYLRQQRIYLTPSEHRARIVLKVYELAKKQPDDGTLSQLHDQVAAYFVEHHTQISEDLVTEVVFQLFWAHCFEFDPDDGRYPLDTQLWDKHTWLADDITNRAHMLDKCDRYLLGKIAERVNGAANIDRTIAMELLYGRVGTPQMQQHIEQLLTSTQ